MKTWQVVLTLLVMNLAFSPASFCLGEVKHYQVPAGGIDRKMSVYLPENYGKLQSSYPVLYLLPGNPGSDMTFFGEGYPVNGVTMKGVNIGQIVEKLVHGGKTKPLIVACPALDRDEELLRYFVPFVDSKLHTIPQRGSRAVAGHSTGGCTALFVALEHPEAFIVAGGFCSYGLSASLAEFTKAKDLKLNPVSYWLYSGTKDQLGLSPPNREFAKFLRANGLNTTFVEDDGDHDNRVAARLAEFIEYLSKHLTW